MENQRVLGRCSACAAQVYADQEHACTAVKLYRRLEQTGLRSELERFAVLVLKGVEPEVAADLVTER